VIVTGRRHDFARPVVKTLEVPLTFITSNGALVKNQEGVVIRRNLLTRRTAKRVLELTLRFRSTAAVVFDRPNCGQVIYERIDWSDPLRRLYFERQRQFLDEISPLENSLIEDPLQVMFTGKLDQMKEVVSILQWSMMVSEYSLNATEYKTKDFSIIDVGAPGCTKGTVLADLVKDLGIAREEVLAIGDNLNDRGMLEYAGVGVVMGNAAIELKQLGYPITLNNCEAGVAAAIDEYVFGR
jgi:HAD superfamily hydrolase (TIGR01484 family)